MATDAMLIKKILQQVEYLKNDDYSYDQLAIYVSGIDTPWEFGEDDEFEFSAEDLLIVRLGPTEENQNSGVPEVVFPLRHIVATELLVS